MTRSPYIGLHVATTGRRATAADIVASSARSARVLGALTIVGDALRTLG